MVTAAVIYDTKYGQTEKIARFMGDVIRRRGHAANVVHVGASTARAAIEGADTVIVLAPVFFGKHLSSVHDFIALHQGALATRRGAFVSVSASAGSASALERADAEHAARAFVASTGWQPRMIACFGGAIAYPRYNPIVRWVLKRMARSNGGPTDTSQIHELTDWAAVERATVASLTELERASARATGLLAAEGGVS